MGRLGYFMASQYSSKVWNIESVKSGVGFSISNFNSSFVLAGCGPMIAESFIVAEACALLFALQSTLSQRIICKQIFLASYDLLAAINQNSRLADWRLETLIENICYHLEEFMFPQIHIIPLRWMKSSVDLAIFGSSKHALILYHQGRDLPHWLMKHFV
ncbi:uncharacterized protein LOC120259160 [Dioscorea cayenensis subsp. rotundata]|uniref:Uncharacterized protein LOC120259160 n=1 Tax=Dioscorea cayennensis subsp. rotundata TaxID=55577 RepID=A0AB40B7J2_DIOCR|nr:uncharacterized protein LOC120259160 [Dioscorea cayenensis subsp. rotundata]